MSGRHAAPESESSMKWIRYAIAAAAVVVVAAAGTAIAVNARSSAGCESVDSVTVAADPAIAAVMTQLVADTSPENRGCHDFAITATDPNEATSLVAGGVNAPDLWVPDSSFWIAKVGAASGQPVDVTERSLATSPVVLAARASEVPQFDSWTAALSSPNMRMGNPLNNVVSAGPMFAALARAEVDGSGEALSAALVPIAQQMATKPAEFDVDTRLSDVAADGGVAVASEQAVVTMPELASMVPARGAYMLNYPLAVTAASAAERERAATAGRTLADLMQTDAALSALSDAGLRTPNAAPLTGNRGVGAVSPLIPTDTAAVQSTLQRFAVLALPSRALVVQDVSGSMNYAAGAETRMGLTVDASTTGLGLFPDVASMGIWAFSQGLGGDGQDWRELVPIRKMTEPVDGTTQRQLLLNATTSLPGLVNGGTGLYDTTLAAWRTVKQSYDPTAINSVIMFTDGANDDPGSISLDELLQTLRTEQDPAKPVIIVTIGITDDADAATLQKISTATGGTSYVARDPAQIPDVFVNAMRARMG